MPGASPRSERLDAEPSSPQRHLDLYRALYCDPQVAVWHFPAESGGARTPEQAREMLAGEAEHFDRHGFGLWVWRERDSGAAVARIGLHHTEVGGTPAVEVGWSVLRARWGEGFATEAARASLRHGFEQIGLEEIVSFTMVENLASQRVMQRAGMRHQRNFTHVGLPHVLYLARAAEWSPPPDQA